MSVLVDDAREMWCPFARGAIDDELVGNRTYDGETLRSCKCIASDCMAWEWLEDSWEEGFCALMGNYTPNVGKALRVVK